MKKKYILWDNDGVLVNTEKWYFRANQRALGEIDISINENEYLYYMQNGISVWTIPRGKNVPQEIIDIQRQKRNEYYRAYLMEEDIEIPHVREVIALLEKHFSMAIVTTSKREDFELIHTNRDLLSYMQFYLTLGDYERAKPFPDPYIKAMEKFNARPDECVVIEDSGRGLRSARAAGIDCIIIRTEFTRHHDFTGASIIVESIEDLPGILFS